MLNKPQLHFCVCSKIEIIVFVVSVLLLVNTPMYTQQPQGTLLEPLRLKAVIINNCGQLLGNTA